VGGKWGGLWLIGGFLAVWRFGCWSGFWGLFAVFVVCSGFGLLVFWPFLELLVVY
jgi:hypothetical protein